MRQDTAFYTSPIGTVCITGDGSAITCIEFTDNPPASIQTPAPYLADCIRQLEEYFAGTRRTFTLPLAPEGTPFQRSVWQGLTTIPYGVTASYADVARQLASPNAFRAVGNANNRNPHCIVVPCHRVIGSDGSMVGYAGGLWRKEWLLKHEAEHSGNAKAA
jgi:methylated-DNA-[protein]-cysteine S-methyltransferase